MQIQDQVFNNGTFADPGYLARRAAALIVAVNCARPSGTCFCASMGTGPRATQGFDLALTELIDGEQHDFLVETGSEKGAAILARLPHRTATSDVIAAAEAVLAAAAKAMGRAMVPEVHTLLKNNLEHPRWDEVAQRCLSCTNCTLVCPTCFCTTVEDTTDLAGQMTERWRQWDSCFTLDFSYIHGGSIRREGRSRYRQWITHKLSTWYDQFGSSGCVGCGRCITWCPVGIDITEEARAIRDNGGKSHGAERGA
jgi:ferredoxin